LNVKGLVRSSAVLLVVLSAQAGLAEGGDAGRGPGAVAASNAMVEGDRYFNENDFVRAHAAFDRAYKGSGSLLAGLKSARALVRLGRLLEAAARYEAIISTETTGPGEIDPTSARQEAAVDLQQLLPRIPRINVVIVGAKPESVALALNGVHVPSPPPEAGVPVNPGRYLVSGVSGRNTLESYVDVGEGDVSSVTLRFGPPGGAGDAAANARRESALSGQRLTGVVTMGVGVASLLTGTFIGWSALNDEDSLAQSCPENRCPKRLASEVDAYEAKKLIALVGVGAGGLLLIGGSILYFTAPSTRTEPRIGAYAAANGAGIWGEF
jgi:hypothetical protein